VPHDGRHDLAHRHHGPPQVHQRSPQPIDPALQIPAARCLLEYFVLQILDDIVEVLGDLEIAVDDVVEHAMDQHRRPMGRQVAVLAPAIDDLVEAEIGVVPDGDQTVRKGKRRQFRERQLAGRRRGQLTACPLGGVDGHERVVRITQRLGALDMVEGILDRGWIDIQFLAESGQVVGSRLLQADPQQLLGVGEPGRDRREVDIGLGDLVVAPDDGTDHTVGTHRSHCSLSRPRVHDLDRLPVPINLISS